MHKRYTVAEAKNQLPAMLHEVERGGPVEITRHGKPVAIVLSFAEYARLRPARVDLWEAYHRWREEHAGVLTDTDVDGLVEPDRDQEPRARVSW